MASAGSWWTEFRVVGDGSLPRSVTLEVPGTRTSYPLSGGWGSWMSGLDDLASGTIVVLHATEATGATAQTVPFRYLVDTTPSTDPCSGTPSTISTCRPLAKGMVSLTMDDSLPSQATLALPVMNKYGVKATIYEVSNQLAQYDMVPLAQALAAAGNEIGSHSRTHADFLTLTADQMDQELGLSQQYLVANVVGPVESFATPMGDYDATAVQEIKKYYASHRTVNPGLNFMGDDVYQLKADGVYGGTTVEAACAQVAEAAAQKGWRIFVFHDFTTQTATQSLEYEVSSFDALLACAKATPGLDIVTTRDGAAMLKCASP